MNPLKEEIERIKSGSADISCRTMYGKTAKELVEEIIQKEDDKMTIEEIDTRLAELEKEKAELLKAKQIHKNKRFKEMSGKVMTALQDLVTEFPNCEWVVGIDISGRTECVNLLTRSDVLKVNCFSQD